MNQIDFVRTKDFFEQLIQLPFIERIFLYGSRARGDYSEMSDLDIAIECPHAKDKDWQIILDIIEKADTLLKIDCVRLDKLDVNNPLKKAIMSEKKLLFEQTFTPEVKFRRKMLSLKDALERLEEAVSKQVDPLSLEADGTIQRFEFCFELFWKTVKLFLEMQGQQVSLPKEVLRTAYQAKLIDDEQLWLDMLNDRNQSSHIYDRAVAGQIYLSIKKYFKKMMDTYKKLSNYSSK